jgi:hypothetical protein
MDTADDFLAAVAAGTADKGARIVIWRLLRTLNGRAKIDTAEPETDWAIKVWRSPDARYMNLVAECEKQA